MVKVAKYIIYIYIFFFWIWETTQQYYVWWSSKQWPPPPSPCLPQLVGSNSAATEGERYGDRLLVGRLIIWFVHLDPPFGVPNGERKGCRFSQPLRVSARTHWRVLVFCVLIFFLLLYQLPTFFRTWDRIVYGMDISFFERCCKICLICLVDSAVGDCWRAVRYTRKPGFVVHTIQGLRLAILSAYVHISHTSFSSHSPVNTTG